MKKFYSRNYWSIGFQSRLYDRLSPESYFESMRRVVACIPDGKYLNLLEAGCGSGLLLKFLEERIRNGLIYTGVDLLDSGVKMTLLRAKELGVEASCIHSDLTSPIGGDYFDVIVAHFCLYTLASDELRKQALENLKSVIKPEGLLILVNPSNEYNADSIIEGSIRLVREHQRFSSILIKQFLIYPFTKAIGLRFIQKQLRSKKWKAYTREEFSQEMEFAGFTVEYIEEVYAGSAFLGVGRLK
jgi:ubiquinone/menaquinone biosynthesis C-methylase UbiE